MMLESPELIQIIPADGWCARYFNEEIIEESGVSKLDNENNPLFRRLPGCFHEKILALGLFKGDAQRPFVAGISSDAFMSFEPITKENFHAFDCLVYLPDFKDEK